MSVFRTTARRRNPPRVWGMEIEGETPNGNHMKNFVDAIRLGAHPNAPFELGFKTSIACRMCVDSCCQGRTLTWDREREQVV